MKGAEIFRCGVGGSAPVCASKECDSAASLSEYFWELPGLLYIHLEFEPFAVFLLQSDVWRNELSVTFLNQTRVINMAMCLRICYLNMKTAAPGLAMHQKSVMNCIYSLA